MDIDNIPLFAALKSRMGYLNQRQTLIAQNVANADTPGFTPKDLNTFSLPAAAAGGRLGAVGLATTQPGHMSGTSGAAASSFSAVDAPDSEGGLDGNQVVLEEQMIKLSDARTDYDAAVSFYQQAITMIETAAKEPGK